MDPSSASAASGIAARIQALDLLANNLANGSTAGYKMDREGYGIHSPDDNDPDSFGGGDTSLPVIQRQWTDFSQGMLQATGNPLDLALSGAGFFAVNGPSGVMYTRNGNFELTANGTLVTHEGFPVRAAGGGTIRVQGTDPVTVSPDGTVSQGQNVVGRLELVNFKDTTKLAKHGGTYFESSDPKATPIPAAGQVTQGKLEASNVVSSESAVRLVGVMRQFEMLQKAISMSSDMNKRAIEEVAHVGT